jgi:hypothetical protein
MSSWVARDFSRYAVFDPDAINGMATALELGSVVLGVRVDRERLALLIVELAKEGVRDPAQLCTKAVNAIIAPN